MNAAIAADLPRLPPPFDICHRSPTSAFQVDVLRMHMWPESRNFFTRDSAQQFAWLWLLGMDRRVQAGRMQFWVRNLVRKEGCSLSLQKADGRFYPDFLCKLSDGTILAVEYKGADRWDAAQDDRDIGRLWAALSGGHCKFIMVRNRKWATVESLLYARLQ